MKRLMLQQQIRRHYLYQYGHNRHSVLCCRCFSATRRSTQEQRSIEGLNRGQPKIQFNCQTTIPSTSIDATYPTVKCTNLTHRFFSTSTTSPSDDMSSSPSKNNERKFNPEIFTDFFGEPITFLSSSPSTTSIPTPIEALAIIDSCIQATTSKGLTNAIQKGGDEYGISTQASHSHALTMVEALQIATLWNNDDEGAVAAAPMLAAAIVSPLIASAGLGYVQRLDKLLQRTNTHYSYNDHPTTIKITHPPPAPLQLLPLAEKAVSYISTEQQTITARETHHLQILSHLLQEDYNTALKELQRLLILCPGDALALSMVMDLCVLLGNSAAAHWAAGSVASYWSERGSGRLSSGGRTSQPGHTIGTSLISLGLAISNKTQDAESFAESSLTSDATSVFKGSFCGGTASYSLAHVYENQGRSSEGLSLCGGYDGVQRFNKCGYLFYDCILGGYGGRFVLDKDGSGAGRQAVRIYDEYFGERIIQYCCALNERNSGEGKVSMLETMKAPKSSRKEMVGRAMSAPKSIFQSIFGGGGNDEQKDDKGTSNDNNQKDEPAEGIPSSNTQVAAIRSAEDVLCWLPPTQQLLSNATMLLLRLTLNGAITQDDSRWKDLRNVWIALIESEIEETTDTEDEKNRKLFPMAFIASSLLLDHDDLGYNAHDHNGATADGPIMGLSRGLCHMGRLMCLGHHHHEHHQPDDETLQEKQWVEVVHHLTAARSASTQNLLEMDLRPILEHALCHAAVLSNDYECLYYARAVCSESVTLRSNCPEAWFRYSVILEKLGDEVAAEDARNTSVSLGSGEGGFA